MDKHFLNPLFSPGSIVVFCGNADDPASQTPQARVVLAALRAQRFVGSITFLDIHVSGTLADLAQVTADLAVIALPPKDVAAALVLVGRIKCRSALVVSAGIDALQAAELIKIARREGIHLADLAQVTADLAVIALPPKDVAAALVLVGRIKCRSALVVSAGIDALQAAELIKIARHLMR